MTVKGVRQITIFTNPKWRQTTVIYITLRDVVLVNHRGERVLYFVSLNVYRVKLETEYTVRKTEV